MVKSRCQEPNGRTVLRNHPNTQKNDTVVDQPIAFVNHNTSSVTVAKLELFYSSPWLMTIVWFMGTTPPTHTWTVCFMNFDAKTKFEKCVSDRNLHPGDPAVQLLLMPLIITTHTHVHVNL